MCLFFRLSDLPDQAFLGDRRHERALPVEQETARQPARALRRRAVLRIEKPVIQLAGPPAFPVMTDLVTGILEQEPDKALALFQMMAGSSLLGALFTMTGLWLAYRFDLTSGASIILVSGIAFLMILGIEKLRLSARKANGRQS